MSQRADASGFAIVLLLLQVAVGAPLVVWGATRAMAGKPTGERFPRRNKPA